LNRPKGVPDKSGNSTGQANSIGGKRHVDKTVYTLQGLLFNPILQMAGDYGERKFYLLRGNNGQQMADKK